MNTTALRLHSAVPVGTAIESLADPAVKRVPSSLREPLEFMAYLRLMSRLLRLRIGTNRCQDQGDDELASEVEDNLRNARSTLTTMLVADAEFLNVIDERVSRWTTMMVVWVVICQMNVVIHHLWESCKCETKRALRFFAPSDHACLLRQRLVMGPKAVLQMSMSEFAAAIDALRSRFDVLTEFDSSVVSYVVALQCRASMFVSIAGSAATFDVRDWVCERKFHQSALMTCHRYFMQHTCWIFVWLNRYINAFMQFVPATRTGFHMRRVPELWRPVVDKGRKRVDAFIERYLKETLKAADYSIDFKKRIFQFEEWLGEEEATTYRYGSNTEVSTTNDILTWGRPLAASDHIAHVKYVDSLARWLREPLAPTGDRHRLFQQLAFIYVIDVFVNSRLAAKFIKWCVALHGAQLGAGATYFDRVANGVRLAKPFIVQRLGLWGVCIPRFNERRFDAIFAPADEPLVPDQGEEEVALIDCDTIQEAFVLWATAVLHLEDGVLHGRVTIRPFLESLLQPIESQKVDDGNVVMGDI